jgi:hypothetical protein
VLCAITLVPLSAANALPVIPGASGFGMDTPAGRGSAVYRVTNLNESGTGSLKECIDGSGPRVCVFEVSGTITLDDDIIIRNPYLTIAGQTAPSPGVTIRGAALWIATSHVLIQHMRFRTGDDPDGPEAGRRNSLKISTPDSGGLSHVVIANCSLSWSIDQIANTWADSGDITFYRNIFSEALYDSIHPQGPHSMGPLLGAHEDTRVTMVGNLFAHNGERNPLSRASELVFVNNVVYNWDTKATDLQGRDGIQTYNSIVGNYYKAGPSSSDDAIVMRGRGDSYDMTPGSEVYVADNIAPDFDGSNPWSAVEMESGLDSSYMASSPPTWNSGLDAMSAEEAFDWVLANAGARPADRDAVDERVIRGVIDGGGRIIDSQDEVGGWPSLEQNRRVLSLPSNPGGDGDGDGYTNLEEWLHDFAAEVEGVSAEEPDEDDTASGGDDGSTGGDGDGGTIGDGDGSTDGGTVGDGDGSTDGGTIGDGDGSTGDDDDDIVDGGDDTDDMPASTSPPKPPTNLAIQ